MHLYQEILAHILQHQRIHVTFPDLEITATELIALECYQALEKIKAVIKDDSLSDFMCVEHIVTILEALGSNGGNRHDF